MSTGETIIVSVGTVPYEIGDVITVHGMEGPRVVVKVDSHSFTIRARRWYDAVLHFPTRLRRWIREREMQRNHREFMAGYDRTAGNLLRGIEEKDLREEADDQRWLYGDDSPYAAGIEEAICDFKTWAVHEWWRRV